MAISMDGTSGATNRSDDGRVRMRRFIASLPNSIPEVYAGLSKGGNACDVCGHRIPLGAAEYEAKFNTVGVRLDRQCFALWQTELAKN